MWMEQLQNWINIFVIFLVSTLVTALAKIYLEKIIFTRKLFDFLGHIVPSVLFFTASASKEMCSWAGWCLGASEVTGFYWLVSFGFMFLTSTFFFLLEISRNDAISKK